MKSLEQIQEENRKAIIMAVNPDSKSYEEALKMELGIGCNVLCEDLILKIISSVNQGSNYERYTALDSGGGEWHFDYNNSDIKIIGKPLTLDRVLLTFRRLKRVGSFTLEDFPINEVLINVNHNYGETTKVFWDLTKQTLELQSPETQIAINKILMGNE